VSLAAARRPRPAVRVGGRLRVRAPDRRPASLAAARRPRPAAWGGVGPAAAAPAHAPAVSAPGPWGGGGL